MNRALDIADWRLRQHKELMLGFSGDLSWEVTSAANPEIRIRLRLPYAEHAAITSYWRAPKLMSDVIFALDRDVSRLLQLAYEQGVSRFKGREDIPDEWRRKG